jgi:hypothetical protein
MRNRFIRRENIFSILCFHLFTAHAFVDFCFCMNMKLTNGFIDEVKGIIENSRTQVIQSVHHVWARMYWGLGRKIFEEKQMESDRAVYGINFFKHLSLELSALYGESFSRRQLERYRQFHKLYPIASALRTQFT